jgi:signal transduction histidine kinase
VQYSGDELDTLSLTFNRMLDQIVKLVHGIRNVSNTIAHDLRTPLAELRSRLEELAVNRPATNETFAEVEAAVADVDRVINIFNALLRLAEIDSGMRRSGFVQIDAAKMVAEVAEFYHPAAELRGITLSLRQVESVPVSGDPLLLTQAVTNLLDNALKYVHDNGTITIDVYRWSDGTVGITVADNGPGIPETEKPKVVERFYRGDTSRGSPGVGLGLTLVEAIAKLHEGTLELVDNHPGLRAYMVIATSSRSKSERSSTESQTGSSQKEIPSLYDAHETTVLDG